MRVPEQYKRHKASKTTSLYIATFIFMALGTTAELFLLEHYEDEWQLAPIILIAISLGLFILMLSTAHKTVTLLFKMTMAFCGMSGLLGVWFHLNANMEFENELHPNSSGITLVIDSLSGALPALAPGSMIAFALIGYLYTLLNLKQPK